ncbi:MAG: gliding motility-associated C-terminal domain-containing protein [Bacteroidota bacterium]
MEIPIKRSLPIGQFNVEDPCSIVDEYWDVFYVYYYDVDNLVLDRLPESFQVSQNICAGRRTKINIADMISLPAMQKEVEYHWANGPIDSVHYISQAGTYYIDAVVDCTSIPITLEVSEVKCDPNVFVPNAFSPNGDGYNDEFQPFISVDLSIMDFQFLVFDRWGTQIFSSSDPSIGWDGTLAGKRVDQGVYIWVMEYTIDDFELGIVKYKDRGDITLLR